MQNEDLIRYLEQFPPEAEVQTVLVGFEQQKFYSADRIAFLDGKGLKNPVIAISVENEADFSEQNCKNNIKKFLFFNSINTCCLLVKATSKLK